MDMEMEMEGEMEGELDLEMEMEMEEEGEMDLEMLMEEIGDGHGGGDGHGNGDGDGGWGEMETGLLQEFHFTQEWALIKASLQEADHPEGTQHGGRTEPTSSVVSDLGAVGVLRICRSSLT